MSVWQVDRVKVTTEKGNLVISGDGKLADRLRLANEGGSVWIVPPPGGSVPLRPDSDWLVDRWVRQWAATLGAGEVTSDYEPKDDDIPDDARELIEERAGDEFVEGRVY